MLVLFNNSPGGDSQQIFTAPLRLPRFARNDSGERVEMTVEERVAMTLQTLNPKSEARNPKQYQNSKYE